MTCTQTSTLGVYLLGALEPEERSAFEAHLSGCAVCRSELVRLAPLPGLLNQITVADFEDAGGATLTALGAPVAVAELPDPVVMDLPPMPPELGPGESAEPAEPRPRRRYWLVAAAAALIVVLTVGGVVAYEALRGTSSDPGNSGVTWSATNPDTGVHADARLIERSWGTEIQVKMNNVPPGEACKLVVWAKGDNGYRETAGWWGTEDGNVTAEIPASTSIGLSMIYKLEVIAEEGKLLVDMHRPS